MMDKTETKTAQPAIQTPATPAGLALIPQPAELAVLGREWELKSGAIIAYADSGARHAAERLAEQLRPATGFELPVRPDSTGDIIFKTTNDSSLGEEGYALRVSDHVFLWAPGEAGLFYGAQTLRQLLPPDVYSPVTVSRTWKLPAVEIRDLPRFKWRGLMLDVARYFMPKNDVLKFIDTMAALKLNTLHWHLTDDQGWRIEIKKYPKLTTVGAWRDGTVVGHAEQYRDGKKPLKTDEVRHGGFYTQDDVREIVDYAAARHITIVPEIDMPGHMQAAIAAYPELGCMDKPVAVRTTWGPWNVILNPEDSTVQFCKDVLAEVMDLFPSPYIHIGGDEAAKDQWESNERIQQLREERGLKDMHEMQSWFIRQIDDFLVSRNRRLVGWDEIAEGGLAKNAAVMWWRATDFDNSGTQIAMDAAAAGHDLIVASNSALYFDYYQSKNESAEPLAIGEFLPLETVYSFEPVFVGLDEKTTSHILGVQGQLWAEYMPNLKHVEYMAFPRACALAEIAWTRIEHKNYTTFLERMKVQEKRFDASAVNHRKINHDAALTPNKK